jgi:glycosyltransferase involved in cell wall biosynthesis
MVKVSVIMPVYNGEKFLKIAIDSLLSQTFDSWELIIVDDGSTDTTASILASYVDHRINTFHQENGGEARARNTGLDQARGEYIAFLDADDVYLPNALADMTDFLDHHPQYDVIFSDGFLCDEHGTRLTRLSDHRPGVYTGNILEPLTLTASVITVPVCTLSRRAVIEENQIRFDPSFVIGPDWDFWIQLACFAGFGNLEKITCLYRVHLTNITRISGKKRRIEDLIRGRRKVMDTDWFPDFSECTKQKFFYNLLIELAAGENEVQRSIINHPAFLSLMPSTQSALLRQIGIDLLEHGEDREVAIFYFQKANQVCPGDRKTSFLLWMIKRGKLFARFFIKAWQSLHQLSVFFSTLGQRKPKPVPSTLGPAK